MTINSPLYPMPFDPPKKDAWPQGEWHSESDHYSWIDETTGYRCAILRNRIGALCGYVQVPQEHRLAGKDHFYEVPLYLANGDWGNRVDSLIGCHGGLTYSNDNWFGFDCAHAGDYCPGIEADRIAIGVIGKRNRNDVYRNFAFVQNECKSLAYELWKFQQFVVF